MRMSDWSSDVCSSDLGMPLHWQLTSRDAKFVSATRTAPTYRLFAMADSVPPKPALIHSDDGAAIAVEVYELDVAAFGSFVAEVPAPRETGRASCRERVCQYV